MENFIVSARKYRPQTFESVVGQKHITSTLENAIANNHLAQALLFCGPRGVGKTTCARILARKINEETGADSDNFDLNIFELDAASNNSVDDIRRLTDQVRIPPQVGQYRVFIIDEVHMLSTSAFNAFLKTLEEPPKHAIFILATTEKHKIIPTILSRCQIFDFKRIRVEDIAEHLQWVAQQEGVNANPDALHIIAQKADGALRDSLSIFDRMVSFSGNELTYEQAIENLNILDYDYYFKTLDLVLNQDVSGLFLLFDEILEKGFDGHHFILGLGGHLRDLLVSQDPKTVQLLEVGENIKKKYLDQANVFDIRFLIKALDLINKADSKYKGSNNQRLLVEITLTQVVDLLLPQAEVEKKNLEPSPVIQAATPTPPPTRHLEEEKPTSPLPKVSPPSQAPAKAEEIPAEPKTQVAEEKIEKRIEELKSSAPKRIGKNRRRGTGISISTLDIQSENNETEEGEPIDETIIHANVQEAFSFDDLMEKWREFALIHEDNKHIYNTLIKSKPKLVNDTDIHLVLDNNTQDHYLNEFKVELLSHLRKGLQNYSIMLSVEITEAEKVKSLYTPDEKFKHMAEINPSIIELKKRLGLDLE